MNTQAFENLELIPELLKKVDELSARIAKYAPPVSTKKEVATLLGVTTRTVNNYIQQGLLKEGYHFNRKNDKLLVFTEEAILEFRDNLKRGIA